MDAPDSRGRCARCSPRWRHSECTVWETAHQQLIGDDVPPGADRVGRHRLRPVAPARQLAGGRSPRYGANLPAGDRRHKTEPSIPPPPPPRRQRGHDAGQGFSRGTDEHTWTHRHRCRPRGRGHAELRKAMIAELWAMGTIRSDRVAAVFDDVHRHLFTPEATPAEAYKSRDAVHEAGRAWRADQHGVLPAVVGRNVGAGRGRPNPMGRSPRSTSTPTSPNAPGGSWTQPAVSG
ncbi:hypothetical protein HUW46_02385 [Amycolatopsis sp. CA-230715]|nr:hypothetical protein HUW46_02385 [Amycolatopsis sp. CA-230715]